MLNSLDSKSYPAIMNAEEVAKYLQKSLSWVYKNWKILGGRKLGGSLFFPSMEDLYERIFCEGKGMEVRLHPQKNQAHKCLVQNEEGSTRGRSKEKGGDTKVAMQHDDLNRHGLLRPGK